MVYLVAVGAGHDRAPVPVEADEDAAPAVGAGLHAGAAADTVRVELADEGEAGEESFVRGHDRVPLRWLVILAVDLFQVP